MEVETILLPLVHQRRAKNRSSAMGMGGVSMLVLNSKRVASVLSGISGGGGKKKKSGSHSALQSHKLIKT